MIEINNYQLVGVDEFEEEHEEIEQDDRASYSLTTTIENKTDFEKCQTRQSRASKQSLEKIDGMYILC